MESMKTLAHLAVAGLMVMLLIATVHAESLGDPDATISEDLFVGGRVGIGTSFPYDVIHATSTASAALRLQQVYPGGKGYLYIGDSETAACSQAKFLAISYTGEALIDYNPIARNGTSKAYFRLFRETNTTGEKSVLVYRGNGSSELSAKIGVDGESSFFGMQGSKVGIGTTEPMTDLDVNGEITCDVITITGGSDLSERFDVASSAQDVALPGMVVSIDAANPGELVVSNKPYDKTVAGVISGAAGLKPGMVMSQLGTNANGKHPVALTGRVYCLCDATFGAITPGDMLTTSPTAGHAMKVREFEKAHGATIGKAMTGLENGKGMVLILVSLQ